MHRVRNWLSDLRVLWMITPILGNLVVLPLLLAPVFARRRRYELPLELKCFVAAGLVFFAYFAIRGTLALPDPGLSGALSRILPIAVISGLIWWCDLAPKIADVSKGFAWVSILGLGLGFGEIYIFNAHGHRIELLGGNPLMTALAFLPFVYVNAWLAAQTTGKQRTLHYLGMTVALVVIGALCGARVVYVTGLCSVGLHLMFHVASGMRAVRHIGAVCFGASASFIITLFSAQGDRYYGILRWAVTQSTTTPETIEASGGVRFEMWRAAFAAIKEAPVFGYGPQNRFAAIKPYLDSDYAYLDYSHPHNLIFTLGTSGGAVGIVLGLGFIFSVSFGALWARRFSGPGFELILNGALVTCLAGMTNYVLFEGYGAVITCLTLMGPLALCAKVKTR